MKLLHTVQYYHPRVGGSELLIRNLSEALAKRGHDVTVATAFDPERDFTTLNGVKIAEFQVSGNSVFGIRGPDQAKYIDFVNTGTWDVVLNYAAQIWSTDLLFSSLHHGAFARVIVPCGYSALRSMRMRLLYWNYFRRLPSYLRQYDAIVYHTALGPDWRFGERHGITGRHTIIPNGVPRADSEVGNFRRAYGIETPYLLLSVSNHLWAKGHRMVFDIMRRLTRNDVTAVILGQGTTECLAECVCAARSSQGRVIVPIGVPREAVLAAFHEADLFICTSRLEYFPLVLLEAMAAGTPFISRDVGNARELRGGLVADTPDEMAKLVDTLLGNYEAREALASAGYQEWEAHYQWDNIVDAYEALYRSAIR